MLAHLENQAQLAAQEIQRLQTCKQAFERAQGRLELWRSVLSTVRSRLEVR